MYQIIEIVFCPMYGPYSGLVATRRGLTNAVAVSKFWLRRHRYRNLRVVSRTGRVIWSGRAKRPK